jgi:hypothetical protein
MRRVTTVSVLAAAVTAGVLGARRLLAMSNTQVHRINQHQHTPTENPHGSSA